MSKKHRQNNLNVVSDSNIDKIKIEIALAKDNSSVENEYRYFCNRYENADFTKYNVERLKNIYEIGNELLNQYFITNCNITDSNIVIQLQYIIGNIMYNINIKQAYSINEQNHALNKKLENTINRAELLEKESTKRSQDIRHVKNDVKSITTTIISIILSISIIPTAIAGIQYIDVNYILPFISSIILFGMITIAFVYSIYQDEVKKSTWAILITAIIITIILWGNSIYKCVNIEKEKTLDPIATETQNNKIKD